MQPSSSRAGISRRQGVHIVKKGKKIVIAACAVAAVGVAGFLLLRPKGEQPAVETQAQAQLEAITIKAQTPQKGDLTVQTEFIGRVQPDEQVNVMPKMAGTVLRTYYNVGDPVKKGDLLFEFDASDMQASLALAKVSLDVAENSAKRALGSALDLQLLQSRSSYDTAKNSFSNANKAFKDYIDDFEPNEEKLEEAVDEMKIAVSDAAAYNKEMQAVLAAAESAYRDSITIGSSYYGDKTMQAMLYDKWQEAKKAAEAAQSNYSTAQASYQTMKTQLQQTRDGYDTNYDQLRAAVKNASLALETAEQSNYITEDKAVPEMTEASDLAVQQARASYETQVQQLEYTKVYAPIDGVVELKSVEEHGMASQQSPAYIISNKEIMVVKFSVPATAAATMAVGDSVQIEFGSAVYDGSVVEVSTMINEQSGLFPVKARVDAPQGALLNGVSVKITTPTAKTQDALLIPIDALYHDDNFDYVYVMSPDGTAVKTTVETGITDDETIEIVSGIDADTKVITSWNPNLIDGALVTEETAQPADGQPADAEASSESDSQEASGSSQEG